MKRKTVLDILPASEIEKWNPGDRVLVIAGTGCCKTTWVKQVLWPYCKEHGLSLYTLANRSMLRDDISHGSDMSVLTYQLLEQSPNHDAWNADVIVMDECHSLATDVMLDYRRNKMLRFFQNANTLIIGLTATPVECVTELFDEDKVYQLERNYSQLESVTLFYQEKDMKAILEREMKGGGRILCFVRSAAAGLRMHRQMPDTAFICSQNAQQWTPETERYKKAISKNRRWAGEQVLLATKVMDVGVSIEDPQVTTVIVETEDYTVDLIQMIGRIRCAADQRIRLYIRVFPASYLERQKKHLVDMRNRVDLLSAEPEDLKYEINMFPLILIDGTQNELAVRWLDQQIRDISSVMERGAEQIIREQLCHPKIQVWKGTTPQRAEIGISLAQHQAMAIIEEMGNRCIYDRKELYARFAQIVPSVLNKSSLRPTRNNINEALRCMKLPYRVSYHQQAKGPLRGKYFYRIDLIAR